jgi:hypothetical protein
MGGTGRDRDVLSNLVGVLAGRTTWAVPGWPVDGVPGRSIHTDPHWSRGRGLLLSANRGTTVRRSRCGSRAVGWVFLTDDGGWLALT